MCRAFPGGRSALAAALGMELETFTNNLYEKNGCRFFEIEELEAMEDLTGTTLLAEYFARRRGGMYVDIPKFEELDQVELFQRGVMAGAERGRVDLIIQEAIKDGFIDESEAAEIEAHHIKHLAAREAEVRAILALFSRKKVETQESEAPRPRCAHISGDK
jgi:hypothetical protein